LTGAFEGFEAVLTEVALPTGQPNPTNRAHRHSGFVLGYVLEGRLRFAIDNQPERIVPTGGTFFEPIGALHSANGATSDGPVRFLAFLVVPKGSPVVVPA
jgi:quercetin dioxygenase-like cupin family protein